MFLTIETSKTIYTIMYDGIEDVLPFSVLDENGEVVAIFKYIDEAEKVCKFLNTLNVN